jgi:hypothetical protein
LGQAVKGLLYYTDNQCQERILLACRKQLGKCRKNYPLVSVSQYPIDFGENIVLPITRSLTSMFKQIVAGLEALRTDIVFLLEHDMLYHPSHFDFVPYSEELYFFNTNVWTVKSDTGEALYFDGARRNSGLVAYRSILLEHFSRKVKQAEEYFKITSRGFGRKVGFEPGRKKGRKDYKAEEYSSILPNLDIKHGGNITKPRFKLSDYQHGGKRVKNSWTLTDTVPYWGKTGGCFDDFLRGI